MLLMTQAGGLILKAYGIPEDLWPAGGGSNSGPRLVSCAGQKDIDIPSVGIDDALGGWLAAEHRVSLGHRDIIHVCGPLQVHGFERRYLGLCQALKSAGLPIQGARNFTGPLSTEFGLDVAARIADSVHRPTAIFVHNDKAATGLLHGLARARLDDTDVLLWWGHAAQGAVEDHVVNRVADAVWGGMSLIPPHSTHFSKIFEKLMETPRNLAWREAGERERLRVTEPGHPIARGLPDHFEPDQQDAHQTDRLWRCLELE